MSGASPVVVEVKPSETKLKIVYEGGEIFITCGDKIAGPFKTLNGIDVVKVAECLGVDPKEVLKVNLGLYSLFKPPDETAVKLGPKELTFTGEGKRITITAENGARVPLGQIFWREGDSMIVGELLYCHAVIEDLIDPALEKRIAVTKKPEPYETLIPVLVLAVFKNGQLDERIMKPYMLLRRIELNGKPIIIEARTRSSEPLNTLMSLPAALQFVSGAQMPAWKDVYEKVRACIKRFVCLDWDPRLYDVAASWAIATYFAEAFNAFPFLYVYGPQGTGKTRLLKTAVYLSRHGFVITDPSEASLFRLAEAFRPAIGVDESLLGAQAWRLIRAAFKKGSFVPRIEKTKKEEFIISLFDPYMPCAFSSTELPRDLGGVEADEARAIFIFMRQMPDPIGRDPEPWDFRDERDLLYLLRLGRAPEVVESFKALESAGLSFRGHEREIWLPLLSIARLVGTDVYQNIIEYALELSGIKEIEQYKEEKTVVRAILLMFRAEYSKVLRSNKKAHINYIEFTASELQGHIKNVLKDWGELDEHLFPKQWDSRKIGRVLTRLGVFKKTRAGRSHYIITAKVLQDLYRRFFGGLGGLGGLKTKAINSESNPPAPQGEAEGSQKQASLDSCVGGGGLGSEKIDSISNPTNPPNPPGEAAGGLGSERMTFEINPPRDAYRPFTSLKHEPPLRWLPCPLCGREGLDFYVKFVDGKEAFICSDCAVRLKKMYAG